jgi:hypothetical protein
VHLEEFCHAESGSDDSPEYFGTFQRVFGGLE